METVVVLAIAPLSVMNGSLVVERLGRAWMPFEV